jgi:hypothetical protein
MRRLAFAIMTALVGVPLAAQTGDPLLSRVTIAFQGAPAADVIRTLAATAGLKVELGSGNLRPVTITLTNVKLGTALNAVCENASCVWRLQGTLTVTPVPIDSIGSLPARVSFEVRDTSAGDVFRALAAAIGVPVTVDLAPSWGLLSLSFKDAPTANVLNALCRELNNCQWDFDAVRGLRVMPKR